MKRHLGTFIAIVALYAGAASSLLAGELVASPIAVSNVWIRATVPAQQVTGAFMTLASVNDVRLVAASSPRATSIEIHEMSMENNVMQMRELPEGIALKKQIPIELKPGGLHLMLMGLKGQMKAGSSVPLTLTFEARDKKRSTIKVEAEVREITATSKGGMAPQ